MRLKNTIKNSFFAKSFKLAKSNLNKVGLMILFDALFLVSVYSLQRLTQSFARNLVLPTTTTTALLFIAFSFAYYLIVIFAYSFFKFCIMDAIKSLFEQTSFSFKRLWQFYLLNLIIAGIFFAVMFFLNFILSSIKQPYQPYVFIFLAVPYAAFLYIILNISHSLFYQEASIRTTINKCFRITFTKIKTYRETILVIILFLLILWISFFGINSLLKFIVSKNYTSYLITYAYFKQASVIVFDLIFYAIIVLNRISFYQIAKEVK